MNLLQISDGYNEVAKNFLRDLGLVTILEKYGRVEFEGAFAGNVMLHGDVDIKVIGTDDYSSDEIFIILKDIHDTCHDIRSLFIKADWEDPRFGNQYPYGKYIGIKALLNDERWKFDIWFISESENSREREKFDISKTIFTEEQRLKILKFKEYRKEHGLKISGQEIYEAVLEKGAIDPEKYFKKRAV